MRALNCNPGDASAFRLVASPKLAPTLVAGGLAVAIDLVAGALVVLAEDVVASGLVVVADALLAGGEVGMADALVAGWLISLADSAPEANSDVASVAEAA